MSRKTLLPGARFGWLTVIKNVVPAKGKTLVEVKCVCNSVSYHPATKLRQGKIKSCGCMMGRHIRKRSTNYFDHRFEYAGEEL
jgi:DNA-binding transcriptional MocR family regulator